MSLDFKRLMRVLKGSKGYRVYFSMFWNNRIYEMH